MLLGSGEESAMLTFSSSGDLVMLHTISAIVGTPSDHPDPARLCPQCPDANGASVSFWPTI